MKTTATMSTLHFPLFTITATIWHGNYRDTLKATGKTLAETLDSLAESSPYIAKHTESRGTVIRDLETTGNAAMGWVDYSATHLPAPVLPDAFSNLTL